MNVFFEKEKIAYNIRKHGSMYDFYREHTDDFKEPDGSTELVTSVKGIYHQIRGHIDKQTSDGTIRRNKPQPAILVLMDDKSQKIKVLDLLTVNGVSYNVTGVNNINNLNIALDICLEMVDDGT